MKALLPVLIFMLCHLSSDAQVLEKGDFLPQAGDCYQKVMAEAGPGGGGDDCIWYYSAAASGETDLSSVVAKPGGFSMLSRDWQMHYVLQGDSLLETGRENRLSQTFYLTPVVSAVYPLAPKDGFASSLRGVSSYGDRLHVGFRGFATASVDGTGVLTDGADTIRNVVRVSRCRDFTQSASLSAEEAENFARFDSISAADSLHVLEYDYEWYAPDSRYPVMEYHESYVINGNDTIPRSHGAWLSLPQSQIYDLGEEASPRQKESSPPYERMKSVAGGEAVNGSPLSSVDAALVPGGGSVDITYSLSGTCDVVLGVYDAIGRQLARTVRLGSEPGVYSAHLPLSYRPIGVVMLIVTINDIPHLIKLAD